MDDDTLLHRRDHALGGLTALFPAALGDGETMVGKRTTLRQNVQ